MIKLIFSIALSVSIFFSYAQTLTPADTEYSEGELIKFNYSGGTGSHFDWIGIYKDGDVPGTASSVEWDYVKGVKGTASFLTSLKPGMYDVYFLCCDGYDIIAGYDDLKITESRIFTRLQYYKTTDSIILTVNDVKANSFVKIYEANDFADHELIPGSAAIDSQLVENGTGTITTARKAFAPLNVEKKYTAAVTTHAGKVLYQTDFTANKVAQIPEVISRIGVGSCAQNSRLPALENLLVRNIDLFIALGDNVYIDTYKKSVLKSTYEKHLTERFELQKLRSVVPIVATWDDHDYGCCDEDKDYPLKNESQKIFLNFWDEPKSSPRRDQHGIYTSYYYGPAGKKLQVIILDTRYFLDDKKPNNRCGKNDYCPWDEPGDKSKTILGDAQWNWLENELQKEADLRLIVSSIQFGNSYNGYEQWAEFPYQQKKFINMLSKHHVNGVFFVSGDVHYSEISKYESSEGYSIYDFTSSALNQYFEPEKNSNRVNNLVYGKPNGGIIDIDWTNETITFTCVNRFNEDAFKYTFPFSEINLKPGRSNSPLVIKFLQED